MSVKKDYQHKLEVELSEWDIRINELSALAIRLNKNMSGKNWKK